MQENSREALSSYQKSRRIALAVTIVIGVIGLLFVGSAHDEVWHERVESLGMVLILVGIGGRLWSTLYIGGHKARTIIDTGPYSIMRNPLYFFSALAAAGVGAQTGSFVVTIVFGVVCWLAFTIVTLREERWLSANLGLPYRDYLSRVPRFFPNPLIYRDQQAVTFDPKLLNRTWYDGLVFILSVPAFEAIEYMQEIGALPVMLYLS